MTDTVTRYQREQELLQGLRTRQPQDFEPRRTFTPEQILQRIGIRVDFGHLPQGYLNLYPQDFVVEEVALDGRVSTIAPKALSPLPPPHEGERTLYVDLVKAGLSTLEACQGIAHALGIAERQISYAGLKDKAAITAQRIAIRQVDPERIAAAVVGGVHLQEFAWGKGALRKGGLAGNRFTIVVRTPVTVGAGWLQRSLERWGNGFYNFYYLQRFGTPRLLSHELGRAILQGDYAGAVRTFLCAQGYYDAPYFNRLREQARDHFGDWKSMVKLFAPLPDTCHLEHRMLAHLVEYPDDFRGALLAVSDQATLWVYAYASYLFNLHLSQMVTQGAKLPARLPLLLHPDCRAVETYQRELAADGISDLTEALRAFFGRPMVSVNNVCATVVRPTVLGSKIVDRAVVLSFELPPAAYATTFLSHLFALARGLPLPDWLDRTRHDSQALLGSGSMAAIEEVFRAVLDRPEETEGVAS
ncbi:MAG: tRNA pseudouridine(13) synthase TruD [Patescibacteria group bacterium]|nr:tRNA pseudouridine(13) synthase TruD [Patescibacteria group bacterium]